MKNVTTFLLTVLLVLMPVQEREAKAYLMPAIICVAVVAAGTATVIIIVKSCQVKYFCCREQDSHEQWCRATTRREAELEGFTVVAGPFTSEAACTDRCNQTNAPTSLLSIASADFVTIEKSTDLKNWLVAGIAPGTIINFEWSETNQVSDKPVFFRVRF